MVELKIKPSHPLYDQINEAQLYIAAMTNPECHYDLKDVDKSSPEFQAELNKIKYDQAELMRVAGGAFSEWLKSL